MRVWVAGAAIAAVGCVLGGCSADMADEQGGPNSIMPPVGSAGMSAAGAMVPTAPVSPPMAGAGAAGIGGTSGAAGTSGMAGAGAGAGMSGAAGSAGVGAAGSGGAMQGVDPAAITLSAIAANGTIGLEWPRVSGATGYRLYWSTSPGVTPQTGQAIEVQDAAYVHRGLDNGTAHHYVVTSLLGSGEGPASAEISATPAGEWVLEALGSGDFHDIVTGARVPRVPIEERVHVLLLPSGYLAEELSIFHDHAAHDPDEPSNDVDRWVDEVFAIDPYSTFREAFVVWYLPRASSAHLGEGGTAFGQGADTASAPLWEALDGEGPDAFAFPPTGSTLNYVASFLLFDPARGRAGVSGHATSCRHPSSQSLRIGCAFGVGHAHEFTHAFANVRDEYLENDNPLRQGDETSNVVGTNRCDELPWAHLLEGRGINDTSGLIGAFGRPERGYHAEFACRMNGTHDNGEYWCAPGDERYTSLTLRPDHLCNWCREITAYQVFRKTGVLAGSQSFESWKSMYRMPFWDTYGVFVPDGPIPQEAVCNRGEPGTPVYEACIP